MKGIIKIAIIAALLISINACSGSSSESVLNSPATNANTTNSANNAASSNTNAGLIPYSGTENTNGVPANADTKVVNIDPKQLKPTNPAMPAADNSEVGIALNEKGAVETRTFKSNPVLAKIEKTTEGRDVRLKVYLKNGKVIPIPAEKIKNFTGDSAEQILQAAGIQPPKPIQNIDTGAATGTKTADTTESKPNGATQTPNAPPVRMPTRP
jgi:hypothetical protein